MQYFRFLMVALICGGLIALLLPTIYRGLKTGKIRHSTSDTYCHKSKNPVGFWSLVALFSGFSLLGGYVIFRIAQQTFWLQP